jgi:hypothetical protein
MRGGVERRWMLTSGLLCFKLLFEERELAASRVLALSQGSHTDIRFIDMRRA